MKAQGGESSPVTDTSNLTNPHADEGFLFDRADASVVPFPEADSRSTLEEADHLPPIVAIGGLFTIKRYYFLYAKLLGRDPDAALSGRERFVTPLNHGVGPIEDLSAAVNNDLSEVADKLGEPIYVVGHSLGGLLGSTAIMDNPEIFAGATFLGGAQEGIKEHTVATWGLRQLAGNPAEAELLNYDSDFMHDHLKRVEEEWPEDIPLDLVATSLDFVVKPPQGFGLSPKNQEPTKRLVVPSSRLLKPVTRYLMRNMPPDVKPLYSPTVVDHINIVRSRAVLAHIDRRRRAIARRNSQTIQTLATAN